MEIISGIAKVETIAVGHKIRELARLERVYGPGRWRKRKGIARVRIAGGATFLAEVRWYEATGMGRKELKIKRILGK